MADIFFTNVMLYKTFSDIIGCFYTHVYNIEYITQFNDAKE